MSDWEVASPETSGPPDRYDRRYLFHLYSNLERKGAAMTDAMDSKCITDRAIGPKCPRRNGSPIPTASSSCTHGFARRWPSGALPQGQSTACEPVCGALLGASGAGKTSVVNHYRRLHPPEETETATRQPVLKVTLQPNARPKGIAADLLLALGDPAWSSGTVQTLTNRAVRLLKHCGVELIVMDEFHHLFDMDRAKSRLRPRSGSRCWSSTRASR